MSTVVGIVQDGVAYIGSDGLATTDEGYRRNVGSVKKIFKLGQYLIGVVGSPRCIQLVINHLFPPPENVMDFPDLLLDLFKEKDCLVYDDNQTAMQQTNFLIATPQGKMYEILCDFQMNEIDMYTAMGSGAHFAFGSLFTTNKQKDAKTRLDLALKAASYFDSCTGYPLDIQSIGKENRYMGEDHDFLKFEGFTEKK